MDRDTRIFVAGHRGMVGSAILRQLQALGHRNLIVRSRAELDLTRQADVEAFFLAERPEQVYLAAAKVGGIHANNTYPADFIRDNLAIELNVIQAAHQADVRRLLFLGSSCIYPREADQPMREDALLTGPLEPTNEPYAIAKIAGIKLCESYNRQFGATLGTDYRSVMPTNLYGPGDNYDLMNSHVIPAMLRKFHLAQLAAQDDWSAIERDEALHGRIPEELKAGLRAVSQGVAPARVTLWGTGTPRREFLHVDDMAAACIHVMNLDRQPFAAHTQPMQGHLNVGTGTDLTIRELAEAVARTVGFTGDITFDPTKPDGTPRKLMDNTLLNRLGWQPRIPLERGLALAYADYLGQTE